MSCQCPCSVDHTLPGGTGPGGCGWLPTIGVTGTPVLSPGVCSTLIADAGVWGLMSCQWPCSTDHTLPGGAGPGWGPGFVVAVRGAGAGGSGATLLWSSRDGRNAMTAMTARTASSTIKPFGRAAFFPAQQLLNFFLLPHGQVSFLPTRIDPPLDFARAEP